MNRTSILDGNKLFDFLISWDFLHIFMCIVVLFQEELSRVICPATFESIYFFSSWNTWRNSCTMLMKAVLWPCLCLQRYARFNQHALEKKFFSLYFYGVMQSTNFWSTFPTSKTIYSVSALRWIDNLDLNISYRRCGPFSGPTRAPVWSGCLECAPLSSR